MFLLDMNTEASSSVSQPERSSVSQPEASSSAPGTSTASGGAGRSSVGLERSHTETALLSTTERAWSVRRLRGLVGGLGRELGRGLEGLRGLRRSDSAAGAAAMVAAANASVAGGRSSADLDYLLTGSQRAGVAKSWRRVKDQSQFCERVLLHVVHLKPSVLRLIPGAPPSSALHLLPATPEFREAQGRLCVLLEAVAALCKANLGAELRRKGWELGREARLSGRVVLGPDSWRLLKTALLGCLQPYTAGDRAALDAWARVADELILAVAFAYARAPPAVSNTPTPPSND